MSKSISLQRERQKESERERARASERERERERDRKRERERQTDRERDLVALPLSDHISLPRAHVRAHTKVQDNRGASVHDELPSKEILKSKRPSTSIYAGHCKWDFSEFLPGGQR